MREIKYRVYKEGTLGMLYCTGDWSITFDGSKDALVTMWCNDGPMDEFTVDNVMQFTGLKDKNGVDVYEGDIVKMHTEWVGGYGSDDYGEHENIGVVAITPSKGVMINRCFKRDLIECDSEYTKTWPVNLRGYRTVVIGNIHENQELLEQVK